jgi:hypothetical protein
LSCGGWEDTTFKDMGRQRQVNVILGNLLCLHYPGEVESSGSECIPAKSCKDYALGTDLTYGNA